MRKERSNIRHIMWRKRVDKSLLKDGTTPIPLWLAKQWKLNEIFNFESGTVIVAIKTSHKYLGELSLINNPNRFQYRLTFYEPVRTQLRNTYHHSYQTLVLDNQKKETLEFLDIEFDQNKKTFILVSWYLSE